MSKKLVLMLSVFCTILSINFITHNQKVLAETNDKSIKVMGKASVKVMPDIAYANLGVQVQVKDPKDVQKESVKITKIVESLKALGVAEKDIKTTGFSIYPEYDFTEKERTIRAYSVVNSITITIRDISKVSAIVDKAVEQGANMVSNISFNISDPTQQYNEALKLAIGNATTKANTIANILGVKIGLPSSVTEQPSYYGPTVEYGNANVKMADVSTYTPISIGELEISATIEATYTY